MKVAFGIYFIHYYFKVFTTEDRSSLINDAFNLARCVLCDDKLLTGHTTKSERHQNNYCPVLNSWLNRLLSDVALCMYYVPILKEISSNIFKGTIEIYTERPGLPVIIKKRTSINKPRQLAGFSVSQGAY